MLIQNNELKVKKWKEELQLIIESGKLSKYLNYIKSKDFIDYKGIIISKDAGYKENNLNFLKEIPFIKSIWITDDISDISGIYNLEKLESLAFAENKQLIDLSKFIYLKEFSCDWNKNIKNLETCKNLQKLIIGKFNPEKKSIIELPPLEQLIELTIIQSTINDLNGLNRYKKLKKLELSFLPKLEYLEGLDIHSLEYLELSSCKKIKNHLYVQRLKNLKTLKMNRCGVAQSINFIKKMPKLNTATFVETNIADGDMTPLFNLKYVGFTDMKHYSHKLSQVNEIIKEKRPSI